MKFKSSSSKGFTLIELLVVVAIISLLSSVVLAVLRDAREKAAYSKFDTEILQLRTAVSLYRADHNNSYPTSLSTFESLVGELHLNGYLPVNNINIPAVYHDPTITPSISENNVSLSCGSAGPSGSDYILYIIADEEVSKLPRLYTDGTIEPSFYYCAEL